MKDFLKNLAPNSARYYTGAALIAVVVTVIVLNIKFLFWAVFGVAFGVAFYEALRLYNLGEKPALYAGAAVIWLLAYFCKNPIYLALVALVIVASYSAYKQRPSRDCAVFLYPTIPFLCFFSIYADFGAKCIVWLIVTVAAADTGAYFGGRAFGRSPLCPTSPKKTLEGAFIGLIVATLVGTIVGMFAKGFVAAFFITLSVAVASIFGDLYESLLKRAANLKDSGNILPGHGGMLDRVDGLLFSSVVMLFLLDWM